MGFPSCWHVGKHVVEKFSTDNHIIESLVNEVDLSEEEAEASLDFLLSEANEVLISAFLVLLRAKGESFEEVVGLARAMFKCCRKVEGMTDVFDIVGTGGNGTNTINISTGACIPAWMCTGLIAHDMYQTALEVAPKESPDPSNGRWNTRLEELVEKIARVVGDGQEDIEEEDLQRMSYLRTE